MGRHKQQADRGGNSSKSSGIRRTLLGMTTTFVDRETREPWLDHLAQHGWALVPRVVDDPEAYVSDFWDWMESFETGIVRTNRHPSWSQDERWPPVMTGILRHYGIGHADFVWRARLEPRVRAVFEEIWGTADLLTSFDGANLLRPAEKQKSSWAHMDQGYHREGMHCVQGLLNLMPNGPDDGGLMVYAGSHKLNDAFYEAFPNARGTRDFVKLSSEQRNWYLERCEEVKINAGPGDFIVWDSRTVHWAQVPTGLEARMAIYICMTPRELASAKDLADRIAAFKARRGTSHWPSPVHCNSENPRITGKQVHRFTDRPTLSNPDDRLVRRLVGYPE